MIEVIVIGDGPAGAAAATALAEAGAKTLLLAERPDAPWGNKYGVWVDELARTGLEATLAQTYRDALVYFDGDEPTSLGRAYGRIDNAKLRATLRERLSRAHGAVEAGSAERVVHDEKGSIVTLSGGRKLRARLVVDATGHRSRFVARERTSTLAAQVAFGVICDVKGPLVDRDRMILMDFRADHLEPAERAVPSFLYAMPLPDGRTFLEETSLVSRPPLELSVLEDRLHRRARVLGLELGTSDEPERCFIPMSTPRPRLDQRIVAFGGAAGMVHPATGYMVREVLERAPELGTAVVRALRDAPDDPSAPARAAWQVIWPRDRRRAWDLYGFGMEVLLGLDSTGVQRFFRAFFSMERPAWEGYLSGGAHPTELMRTMARVFAHAPWALRGHMMSQSFTPAAGGLLRGIFGVG